MRRVRLWVGVLLAVGFGATGMSYWQGPSVSAGVTDDPSLEQVRREVKMLDDLYKTAVVLITQSYVEEDSDVPAGTAAKKLFEAMKQKGWHEVRLIDATGKPIDDVNSPQQGFETRALAALQKGSTFFEEVERVKEKRYLRAATPIPVVLDKCIMCHEHYKSFKEEGKIIGMLGYTVPIP
jgi:hypothetical protein